MNAVQIKLLFFLLVAISSCSYISQGLLRDNSRHARVVTHDIFGDSATRIVYPSQNWSAADSLWFYNITQGSNLLPYSLFLHLEVAGSERLFRSAGNINRLRYLPQRPSHQNPDGLPVGWVKDEYQGKEFIGFTCAACHTSQINYRGVGIRIDGAPALADMDSMLNDLGAALDASLANTGKFTRLAKKVLRGNYPAQTEAFRREPAGVAAKIQHYNLVNRPVRGAHTIAYGYARLDAFGRIYNRVLAHLTPGEVNFNPPSAPVSYAYLWDTPYHDFVQWNGVGDNQDAGPLGRNAGQVVGAFASIQLQQQPGDIGYRSSIDVRNLNRIEQHLKKLWSPQWQDLADQGVLPAIDLNLAERGRQVFLAYQCHTCHKTIARTDPGRRVIAQFSSLKTIGTDITAAVNALTYKGKSGSLQGARIFPLLYNSPRFEAFTPVLPAVSNVTAGVVIEPDHDKSPVRGWMEKAYDLLVSISDNPVGKTARHMDFELVNKHHPATLAAYKARPLNGIWATAPYLHNGSVATLEELLMPSCSDAQIAQGKSCRRNRFVVGAREFDPLRVGFSQPDSARHPGLFVFDTQLPGNSNKGHEFAAGVTPVFVLDDTGKPVKNPDGSAKMRTLNPITPAQRRALVEYLKTL